MMLLQLLLCLLPWRLRRNLLNYFFGWKIHPKARIGLSLFRVSQIEMAAGASIRHFNMVRGLNRVVLRERASIGRFNWITAHPTSDTSFFQHIHERDPSLIMGQHSSLTNRHTIDCTGGIEVGAFTTIGGWGSQLVGHSIDIAQNRQDAAPIKIGQYCFVGTRVILLKGSSLPNYSVLAAGSVLNRAHKEEYGLYSGVPAKYARELSRDLPYFKRLTGRVH